MAPATRAHEFRRLSDERLSRRLAQGEAAAFDELYRRYQHRLAAYGAHLLGDGAAGEDVAQVSLLNAYQALRRGTRPEHVRPWLYRIAHNAALDSLERSVFPVAEPRPAEAAAPETGSSFEPSGALLKALAQLSERQRRVYLLREVHGMRIAEIAGTLALTAQQVEQTLFAARNGLAETLVFGERLDCEAVRRLSAGPLGWREQRALQRHFRACAACREVVPRRRRALVLLPFLPVDWLRRRVAQVMHWSPAAKTGAVAAAAVIAAAPPLAVRELGHGGQRTHGPAPAQRSVAGTAPAAGGGLHRDPPGEARSNSLAARPPGSVVPQSTPDPSGAGIIRATNGTGAPEPAAGTGPPGTAVSAGQGSPVEPSEKPEPVEVESG